MGQVLENGWLLVMQTLQQLDIILNTPHKVQQSVSRLLKLKLFF